MMLPKTNKAFDKVDEELRKLREKLIKCRKALEIKEKEVRI